MTTEQLLSHLRDLEAKLRSAEVQEFFRTKSQETRDRFVSHLDEITVLIQRLSNKQLKGIANKLDELSSDLQVGIDNLKDKLNELKNAVAVINTISTVLGLVARVLAFAA